MVRQNCSESDYAKPVVWSISPDTRSILDSEGGIILDLQKGKFCGLNPTGARIWRALQENGGVSTQASLIEILQREFEAPRSDLEHQVDRFLSTMQNKRLLCKTGMGASGKAPTAIPDSALGSPLPSNLSDQFCSVQAAEKTKPPRIGVAVTVFGLVAVQLVLKIGGLRALYWILHHWPVRRRSGETGIATSEVSQMLNSAARFCPRRAWCLERAAITVCWLRWRGIPAEFVIGCRRLPFASHAWAEVDCTPVNEDPAMIALYSVIDRY